ncbi:MAG: hypothetical protein V1784_00695 [bacterium]
MKKLWLVAAALIAFLAVPPAKAALSAFLGFDILRQWIMLHRIDEADSGAQKSEAASGGERDGKEAASEKRKSKRRDATARFTTVLFTGDAESAKLSAEIAFSNFTLEPAEGDTLIYVEVDYEANKFPTPVVNHRREDGQVMISLESAGPSEERHLNLSDLRESKWHVRLGRNVVWSLSLDLGYCENELELGGLKVESLTIESGLSETSLSFSEPNGIVLERCDIETGLGSFEAVKLGNATMRRFLLENGLGSSVLDFTGSWPQEDLKATIESGMGSVKMRLPDGLPVIMQVESAFGSADLPRFHEIDDGIYRSISYMEGAPSLQADVSVGMGSITVIWVTKERYWRP